MNTLQAGSALEVKRPVEVNLRSVTGGFIISSYNGNEYVAIASTIEEALEVAKAILTPLVLVIPEK